MRNDQKTCSQLAKFPNSLEALVLKIRIANSQCFVHDKDVGSKGSSHGERYTQLHSARVGAHRLIEVLTNLGEFLDRAYQVINVLLRKSHQSGCMVNILSPRKVRTETHAELKQSGYPPSQSYVTLGCAHGPGDELEESTLACPILPNNTDCFAGRHTERDAPQHPSLVPRFDRNAKPGGESLQFASVIAKSLAKPAHSKKWFTHNTSTISGAARLNNVKENINKTIATIAMIASPVISGVRP